MPDNIFIIDGKYKSSEQQKRERKVEILRGEEVVRIDGEELNKLNKILVIY